MLPEYIGMIFAMALPCVSRFSEIVRRCKTYKHRKHVQLKQVVDYTSWKKFDIYRNVLFRALISFEFIIIIYCHFTLGFKENSDTDYVMNYMVKQTLIQKSIVITKSSNYLSSTLNSIITEMVTTSPSIIINIEQFQESLDNQRIQNIKQLLRHRSWRAAMHIIFSSNHNHNKSTIHDLVECSRSLGFFTINTKRPKYLLFIIDGETGEQLRSFFKTLWTFKILNVAVIEIIKQKRAEHIHESIDIPFEIKVHHYNPFNDTYHVAPLTDETILFSNKLQNMYGYKLDVGFKEDFFGLMIDHEYSGNDIWRMISGIDVSVTKALADYSNCIINLKVSDRIPPHSNLHKLKINETDIFKALINAEIEFVINKHLVVKYEETREKSIFLYPTGKYAVVKQYGKIKLLFGYEVLVIGIIIVLVLLILTSILRVYSTNKIWKIYNVIYILVFGQTMTAIPITITERVCFLTMILISAVFTVCVLEYLIDMYYFQVEYLDLRSLSDIIHHKLIPYITSDIMSRLKNLYRNDSVIQAISRLQPAKNRSIHFRCKSVLIQNSDEVQGCYVNYAMGIMLSSRYSSGENGWILSFIEEPILPGFPGIFFTMISPYVPRFNEILRRCFEGGFIDNWFEKYVTLYAKINSQFFGIESLNTLHLLKTNRSKIINVKSVSSQKKLLIILLGGKIMLFSNKLQNMYGYKLDVGFIEASYKVIIDQEYSRDDVWRIISGLDVNITRAVVNYSNFTIYPKVSEYIAQYKNLQKFNITESSVDDVQTKIEFVINLYTIFGFGNLAKTRILIALVIIMLTNILRVYFYHEIWEIYNLIYILTFDSTMTTIPNKATQKIFFLVIIFISSSFFVCVLDNLTEMNYFQMVYLDLRSLRDIVQQAHSVRSL
ncbi:hypothetical protein TSAR_001792 [Trichomalopsis sarcophagae]|uniref:Uncharacterized protein n=1 Tax=Trichomalopsis sarcophagae TaxID=543379 RepID=A0A232EHB7_9HYME|nr:hypothetical protein TSAR_001792 [Trichomalopsis sarcophagae]